MWIEGHLSLMIIFFICLEITDLLQDPNLLLWYTDLSKCITGLHFNNSLTWISTITNKFLLVFFISVTHLFDYMHYQCDLIHTKVMPRRYPSTCRAPLFYCICYVCISCLCWKDFYWSIWARDVRYDSSVYWYNPVRQTHNCCQAIPHFRLKRSFSDI